MGSGAVINKDLKALKSIAAIIPRRMQRRVKLRSVRVSDSTDPQSTSLTCGRDLSVAYPLRDPYGCEDHQKEEDHRPAKVHGFR